MSDDAREMLPRDEQGVPILTEWMRMRAEHLLETDQEAVARMLEDGTMEEHLILIDRECQDRLGDLLSLDSPSNLYRSLGLTAQMEDEDPQAYHRLMTTVPAMAREQVCREIVLRPIG